MKEQKCSIHAAHFTPDRTIYIIEQTLSHAQRNKQCQSTNFQKDIIPDHKLIVMMFVADLATTFLSKRDVQTRDSRRAVAHRRISVDKQLRQIWPTGGPSLATFYKVYMLPRKVRRRKLCKSFNACKKTRPAPLPPRPRFVIPTSCAI